MPNIDLTKVIELASKDELWATRGKAIQAYANLEQALARLVAVLAGTTPEAAATILFRISSSDSRNKILEKLFRQKFGDQFNRFRNTLFDQIRPIDIERNEIVHWNAVCKAGATKDEQETADVYLMPPTFSYSAGDPPKKHKSDILKFDTKCDFYARLINMFCTFHSPPEGVPDADKQTWRDIFSQPIEYPPPSTHPLCRTSGELPHHITTFLL
jgi:hypothetical protein